MILHDCSTLPIDEMYEIGRNFMWELYPDLSRLQYDFFLNSFTHSKFHQNKIT